jgi:1,2-phenylacetyl-CoA epoxidase catalytic subunit
MDWAATIARHVLYETADAIRITALASSGDPVVAGIAARIDREEIYHRMHAEMWLERLRASDDGRTRLDAALDELWPYGLGLLDEEQRPELRRLLEERLGRTLPDAPAIARGTHEAELAGLLDEMTMVRRSAPAGARW